VEAGSPVPQAAQDRRDYFAQDDNIKIGKEVAYRAKARQVACSIVIANH
jgi:hypothetical protein